MLKPILIRRKHSQQESCAIEKMTARCALSLYKWI